MPFRIEAADRDEVVIVLHGLGRSARSMRLMQLALVQAGFAVLNADYPSTREPFDPTCWLRAVDDFRRLARSSARPRDRRCPE